MLIKRVLISFIIFTLILVTGCSNKEVETKGGLKIYGWNSSLGSVDKSNANKQRFSYDISLINENPSDIFVKSLQTIINSTIKDKILDKGLIVNVNKNLKTNGTINIRGEIIIDTKGLSKTDILKLEPFVTDIKVTTDQIIDLNIK